MWLVAIWYTGKKVGILGLRGLLFSSKELTGDWQDPAVGGSGYYE